MFHIVISCKPFVTYLVSHEKVEYVFVPKVLKAKAEAFNL